MVYKDSSGISGLGFIQEAIVLVISMGAGVIVYAILVKVFKVEEINMLIDIIKKKLKK